MLAFKVLIFIPLEKISVMESEIMGDISFQRQGTLSEYSFVNEKGSPIESVSGQKFLSNLIILLFFIVK